MVNLPEDNRSLALIFQYSLPVLIIAVVSRTFPVFSFIYYLVIPLFIFYIFIAFSLKLYKQISVGLTLILFAFPAYCLITSAWSLYPSISVQRSLYLVFIYTGLISAVLLYKKYNKNISLKFLIPANIIVIILSIFSLLTNIPANSWSGGNGLGFMGFAGHQNILAASILFTFPGATALVLNHSAERKKNFKVLSFYFLILTFDFLILILTYSRASWFALLIGFITFIIVTKNIKIILSLISLFIIIIIIIFTVPSVKYALDSLQQKGDSPLWSRREILWHPSYEASKLGGLIGLGYGVSAPDIKTPELTGSYYENGRYIREKGNSVLAVIEETGIIGLLLFLLPIFSIFIKLKIRNSLLASHFSLLTAFLVAFLVHAQFEAWWVGVGSVQLPLFYIILFLLLFEGKIEKI
jgi:O-antigen ligase